MAYHTFISSFYSNKAFPILVSHFLHRRGRGEAKRLPTLDAEIRSSTIIDTVM